MQAGRRALFRIFLTSVCALALLGCRNTEPLENELRAKDFQMREMLDELSKSEDRTEALNRELIHLRQTGPKVAGDEAARLYGLKRIVLGRMTGGYDNDGLPGDEALQVVFEPRDADDRPTKITGLLQITALEINYRGQKLPLCTWDIPPDKLATSWRNGLLSTGYHVILPWKKLPTTEQLRIEARFSLAEGMVYEADRDVKVRLVPGARTSPPMMPPEVVPFPPNTLPPPATGPNLTPAGNWQPAPIHQVIQLGRPEPVEPLEVPEVPD